ncbi:hypothetical protein IG631_24303 [Alternaria alternata]|nr:hypothetical protein IG631_24303 [Alternaria alternata]
MSKSRHAPFEPRLENVASEEELHVETALCDDSRAALCQDTGLVKKHAESPYGARRPATTCTCSVPENPPNSLEKKSPQIDGNDADRVSSPESIRNNAQQCWPPPLEEPGCGCQNPSRDRGLCFRTCGVRGRTYGRASALSWRSKPWAAGYVLHTTACRSTLGVLRASQ